LLLAATVIFTFGRSLAIRGSGNNTAAWLQFPIAIYGGYFGAGIGILMLAMMQILGMKHIHEMNAVKTVLGSTINAVAFLVFIFSPLVVWNVAVVMIIGSIIGGYAGARLSLKVSPQKIRIFISAIGFAMSGYFFLYGV
jgi:uncharacterized membrane protein YfcA